MKHWILLLVIALPLAAIAQQEPPLTLVTFYSAGKSSKLPFGGGPGVQPWWGHLWVDDHKITFKRFGGGHFLTMKLSEGDHSLAGETNSGHEGSDKTVISIHKGIHYFIRLTSKSSGAPFAPIHSFAEQVTCQEAYREAVALEPVKLKRIQKSWLDYVVRESYFPECESEPTKSATRN